MVGWSMLTRGSRSTSDVENDQASALTMILEAALQAPWPHKRRSLRIARDHATTSSTSSFTMIAIATG